MIKKLLISLFYMQARGFRVSHHPVCSLMTTVSLLMTMKMMHLFLHPRGCMCQKVILCTLCYINVTHFMCNWHFLTSARQRLSLKTTADLFRAKFERKAELKEKELELRRMELEFQRRKWELEEEERKQKLQLDAEERRALIDLLKSKMT